MKKNMNVIGVIILIGIFLIFYLVATFFLDRRNISKEIPQKEEITQNNAPSYENQKDIVYNLYSNMRILYDVVNNKFEVDPNDTITIGDSIYKKIINFNEVMNSVFTENGINSYLSELSSYFAYTDSGHYLIGNLVSYQTYYFHGDETNIYIINHTENEIDAIIYERWTTGNRNTLATIKVINKEGTWLVDNLDILKSE